MKKKVCMIVLAIFVLSTAPNTTKAWNNDKISGYGTADNPAYGTHDWIAEEAYNLLPTTTKGWLTDNLAVFLWGTSAPDLPGASYQGVGGYGDSYSHHNYYNPDGTFVSGEDDASTRAQEEYNKALTELNIGNLDLAAYCAGAMAHYIADLSVWGHVMQGEVIHSRFESDVEGTIIADYFNDDIVHHRSNTFTITFDGTLEDISAFEAAKELGWNTYNDDGDPFTANWMDTHYPGGTSAWYGQADSWPESEFKVRVSESINLAVNYIAAVLNKLTLETGIVAEGDFLILTFSSIFIVVVITIVVVKRSNNRRSSSIE